VNNSKKKEIAYKLIKNLNKDKNSLSVTLTGSYSEHFDSNIAGDIDIVIICKKLDKDFFDKCISKLRKIKKKYFGEKNRLIINNTFGPIKFYTKNSIVFHLMIYDLKSHIEHTIKSPFTCYDWERSKIYVGKSLKELSPVYKLQLRDFIEARRSTKEYLDDISKNRISYREYDFKNKKKLLKKKYFKIDKVNKRDFIYHTIKFLLVNCIKYEKEINSKISEKNIIKKFYEIVKNKSDLTQFIKLKEFKDQKSNLSIKKPKKLAVNFINKFDQYIKQANKSSKVYFSRHKKTKMNKSIFLGQKLDPKIINQKNTKEFKKIRINKCFSSPLTRCKETAKIVCKPNRIITSNYLKEIDYGNAEGLNIEKFKKDYSFIFKKWEKGLDPKFPNGESSSDVVNRLKRFIKIELNSKKIKNKKNILIFTHNVILRCLVGYNFKIDKKDWFKINIKYFDLLEFELKKDKLLTNIDRNKYLSIFNNFYYDLSK
jgi:ribonuclease H / adenosylcobalamin/alpha-ribazole phosphatase